MHCCSHPPLRDPQSGSRSGSSAWPQPSIASFSLHLIQREFALLVCFLALPVIGLGVAASCAQTLPELELTEVYSYSIPESIRVAGVNVDAADRVIVWSDRGTLLMLIGRGGGTVRRLGAVDELVSAAIRKVPATGSEHTPDVIELLTRSGAVVRMDSAGRVVSTRMVSGLQGSTGAARLDEGWFAIITSSGESTSTLVYAPDSATNVRPINLRGPTTGLVGTLPLRLSSDGGSVIVTQARYPFSSVMLAPSDSNPILRFSSLPTAVLGDDPASYIAMPILPIGGGFVQTLADLGSDRRILILYSAVGTILRTTALDAPLALVAHRQAAGRLLALRRAGATEVVGYSWDWR